MEFFFSRNGANMKEARLRIIFQKFNWGKIREDYPKSVEEKKIKPIKEKKTKPIMKVKEKKIEKKRLFWRKSTKPISCPQ